MAENNVATEKVTKAAKKQYYSDLFREDFAINGCFKTKFTGHSAHRIKN
jgi:hypothetical protein